MDLEELEGILRLHRDFFIINYIIDIPGGTDFWQSEPCRDTIEDEEQHVRSSNETNVINFVKSREIGAKPLFPIRTLRNRTLAELLKDRWQCADRLTVLLNATEILDRKLYVWEGAALDFLLDVRSRFEGIIMEEDKQLTNFISKASHQSPIGFTDILEVLHINGIDFNRTCGYNSRVNVLVEIFVTKSFGKDVEEAVRFLAGHGLDLIESGHAALMECGRILDPNSPFNYIGLRCILKVIEILVRVGFSLHAESHRGSLIEFLSDTSTAVGERGHAVGIYKFFIDNGFEIASAFEAICSYKTFHCVRSAEMFDSVIAVFRLLYTSSRTSMHFENDEEKQGMLQLFSKDWCELEDLTLSDLIRRSTQVGIHSKAIGERNANFLIAVCQHYKGKDLADVVRFLRKSGVEVHHVDIGINDALLSLSKNKPNSRQAVYDAARVLIENRIDIHHEGHFPRRAFLSFLFSMSSHFRCCRYKLLLDLKHSHFWDTLNLLIGSRKRIDPIWREMSVPTVIYEVLRSLPVDHRQWNDCVHLTRRYFPLTDTFIEVDKDPNYFQGPLDLINRLLKAGASTKEKVGVESDSALFYVCATFKGDELVALVKLLCEHGVDVNATSSSYTSSAGRLNAMDVLRRFNASQASVFSKVAETLKLHGFKE